MLAAIETACSVPLEDVLLELLYVLGDGAQGRIGGVDGGISRWGQEHGESFSVGTPELEHLDPPRAATETGWSGGVYVPTSGKEAGRMPKSMQQLRLRYGFWTWEEM